MTDGFATPAALAATPLSAETPIALAAQIWLARLELAGIDDADLDRDETAPQSAAEQREIEAQRHHSPRTIDSYRTAVTLFARWAEQQGRATLGSLELDDPLRYALSLRRRDYDLSQRAAAAREAGQAPQRLAARTIHAYIRPMLGLLALADSFQALPFRVSSVSAEIRRRLPRLPTPHAPTPPDLRRLVTYYDKLQPGVQEEPGSAGQLIRLRNAALVHLLFSSAARISEALSIDLRQIVRDRAIQTRVTVLGKGREQGVLFIRRPAEQALRDYLAARGWPRGAEPLFISYDRRSGGMRLSRVSGWRIITGAAEALAQQLVFEGREDEAELLRATTPHTFRHFVGYHLLNEGVALAEVSQILRHRSIEVTRAYYASYRETQLQEVHDQYSADPYRADEE